MSDRKAQPANTHQSDPVTQQKRPPARPSARDCLKAIDLPDDMNGATTQSHSEDVKLQDPNKGRSIYTRTFAVDIPSDGSVDADKDAVNGPTTQSRSEDVKLQDSKKGRSLRTRTFTVEIFSDGSIDADKDNATGGRPKRIKLESSPSAEEDSSDDSDGDTAAAPKLPFYQVRVAILIGCQWDPELAHSLWSRGILKDELQQCRWFRKCIESRLGRKIDQQVTEKIESNVVWIMTKLHAEDFKNVMQQLKPHYQWKKDLRIDAWLRLNLDVDHLPMDMRGPASVRRPAAPRSTYLS
ncbi:hypothetical protein IWZ01DRAFT_538843 [Phyllosticta capitalensis]